MMAGESSDYAVLCLACLAWQGTENRNRRFHRPSWSETYLKKTQRASSGPTHKRTKRRAPVWGSEFTKKDAALQGGMMVVLMPLFAAALVVRRR